MRIDKFLKFSRLTKRRTAAQEMIEIGAVRLGGKTCKSSSEVSAGSIIEIAYTARVLKVEVLCADEAILKRTHAEPAYKVIEERRVNPEERPW